MKTFWNIFCPYCRKSTTLAKPPGSPDFIKKVKCSICNKVIDANNGTFRRVSKMPEREEIDLLEIEA